jgi:hypothetical protein
MIPRELPTVDGSDLTLICVVVVPSTGGAVANGEGGTDVAVGGGVDVSAKVAVTKIGVDVPFSSVMASPQPVRRISADENTIMIFWCTSLLYPRIKLRVERQKGHGKKKPPHGLEPCSSAPEAVVLNSSTLYDILPQKGQNEAHSSD